MFRRDAYRMCLAVVAMAGLGVQMALADPTTVDAAGGEPVAVAFSETIEADWAAQEQRLGSAPDDPQAIRLAMARADRLLEDLARLPGMGDLRSEAVTLKRLRPIVGSVELLAGPDRAAIYREVRWVGRSLALKNPLLADKPLVFLKRRRFVCQMLHEYLGYYYDYADIAGGSVCILERPGHSFEVRDLIAGRLPRGNYTTLALSCDAETVYFAFAERAEKKPDYYSPDRRCFHIYAMDADGGNLRQLTDGRDDDFDPCPLPDGGVAFMSTRRGGFTRCNNPWEPLPAHTLHRMAPDGSRVQTLSFHETSEWHPSVLPDGRIIYTRWDYVDRSAANFHGLWISNPDGTNAGILFGNYTTRINACYQPRAIPGSNRVMFIAGAHHADVGGSLVIVDPARVSLNRETGQDEFDSVETLTPEVCFPEAPDWPKSYFHSPWPLSENYFLVSFSFDPLPGMSSGESRDTQTGLYYMDRFGNMELLYREQGISSMYPVPLAPRPRPPVIPSTLDPELGKEGEFMVTDVNRSLLAMPAGRPIRMLRVYQILPKTRTHIANQPRIGHANAESARMLLGTVPVEKDGSAYFRAPAGKPLYFQAVDADGRAVQSMRSSVYLQPGERRSCVGCHERPGVAPASRQTLAAVRPPSEITAGPDGARPFSFPRLVQPVLDRHCTGCHDGSSGEDRSKLILTGQPADPFTQSYDNLRPFVRWHEWGGESISPIVTRPGRQGTDESPLVRILTDDNHHEAVQLPESDRRRLYLWLDGNAPFYGTYEEDQLRAQQLGQAIGPPAVQ